MAHWWTRNGAGWKTALEGASRPWLTSCGGAIPTRRLAPSPQPRRAPRPTCASSYACCRVVLYNDSHNTMDHVVSSLLRCVPSLIPTVAERIMMEAHTTGRATVISCLKEQAEYYCERLQTCGLTATVEPA